MKHVRILALTGAAIMAAATGVPTASAQVVQGEEHCVVKVATWDRLNVRQAPNSTAEIVTHHRYGDCGIVVVGDAVSSWYPVEDGHFEGWVNGRYLSMVSPSMYCVGGVDSDDVLNLRAYPSSVSRIVTELYPHQCDIAFLPYAVSGWQKVRVDGYEGWVNREFVSGE